MRKFKIIALVMVLVSCTREFHEWNADRVNDIREDYLLQDADKRIADYEWFFSQYAAIQATRAKVQLLTGKPEQIGVQMVLETMIAEYNARSRMITRDMWKSDDLPYLVEEGKNNE